MAMQTEPFRGRIFQEEDLYSILKRVRTAVPKWRWVGLALGFKDSVLDEIEATDKDPKECFRKILSRWLKWAEPNHDYPSSRSLAEALRSEMVEEERLAKDLERYFSETGTKDTETVESPPAANAATTSLPHTDTQNTVMVESPPTPKPRTPIYMYDLLKKRLDVIRELTWEEIVRSLHETVKKQTMAALEKRHIPAEVIANALVSHESTQGTVPLRSVLQKAGTVGEVFSTMDLCWSYLNPEPLEYLINKFSLDEVRESMEQYKRELERYMRETTLAEFFKSQKRSQTEQQPEARKEPCIRT